MSGFTEHDLVRMLQDLECNLVSIKTLSLWLMVHKRHHAAIVHTWYEELLKAEPSKQLTLLYLCYEVIHISKSNEPEHVKEFGLVLVDAFKVMSKAGMDATAKQFCDRILVIWENRGIYAPHKIQEFKDAVLVDADISSSNPIKRRSVDIDLTEAEKKAKIEATDDNIEALVNFSPNPAPPGKDVLVKCLFELDATTMSDEELQENIASLPSEVTGIEDLSILESKTNAELMEMYADCNYRFVMNFNPLFKEFLRDMSKEINVNKRQCG